ncbi:DUF1425 domain-containing protein [Oxalobacter sp. OttesenSCG-928-P03]|nr:DUF1425 domain-containing protein [Oxalobacter sp. OttesenSCG-928-P03]
MSRIRILLFLFCLGLLASCGRSTHEYLDNDDVRIKSIKHTEDGDFLVVNAVLVNDDGDDINHSVYRMLWFDKDGMMIEQSAWRPLIVKGKAPIYIKERSTVPGAKEYTLIISNDAS